MIVVFLIFYLWGCSIALGIAIGTENNVRHLWIKILSSIAISSMSWITVGFAIGRLINK
jgi:hypothetical protein